MDYQTIAQGDSNGVPNINLQSGDRITVECFVNVEAFTGVIQAAVGAFGWSASVSGSQITVYVG